MHSAAGLSRPSHRAATGSWDLAPIPVIGAINGAPPSAPGLQLAMQCDLRGRRNRKRFFPVPRRRSTALALDKLEHPTAVVAWSVMAARGRCCSLRKSWTADVALQTGMGQPYRDRWPTRRAWGAEIAGLAPLAIQHAKTCAQRRRAPSSSSFARATRSSSIRPGAARDVHRGADRPGVEKRPPNFQGA